MRIFYFKELRMKNWRQMATFVVDFIFMPHHQSKHLWKLFCTSLRPFAYSNHKMIVIVLNKQPSQ